jgi:hypothetical protein
VTIVNGEDKVIRLFVDFNSMNADEQGRVYIGKVDSPYDDQERLRLLSSGSEVLLEDGELEVEATVEFDEKYHIWFGKPDWSTRRELT